MTNDKFMAMTTFWKISLCFNGRPQSIHCLVHAPVCSDDGTWFGYHISLLYMAEGVAIFSYSRAAINSELPK